MRRASSFVVAVLLGIGVCLAQTSERPVPSLISAVERKILSTPGYTAFDWLSFSVAGGQVSLYGLAIEPVLKDSAEKRVRSIEGVTSVKNNIEVLPRSNDDRGIRHQIYERLFRHAELYRYEPASTVRGVGGRRSANPGGVNQTIKYPIHILVRDAAVTLEGHVEYPKERELAETLANQTPGVTHVVNNLLAGTGDSRRGLRLPEELAGRVSIADGTPVTEALTLRIVCGEQTRLESYTERDGSFRFRFGPNAMLDVGPEAAAALADSTRREPPPPPQPEDTAPEWYDGLPGLEDLSLPAEPPQAREGTPNSQAVSLCRIVSELIGYESASVAIHGEMERPRSVSLKLTSQRLLARAPLSSTTASAAPAARKAYDRALQELLSLEPDFEKVAAQLQRAVNADPNMAAAWHMAGKVHTWRNQREAAQQAFANAVAADPEYLAPYLSLLPFELQTEQWDDALKHSAKILELHPFLTEVRYNRAVALHRAGSLQAAEEEARLVLSADDGASYPDAHFLLGSVLAQRGAFPEAELHLEALLRANPSSVAAPEARRVLASWRESGVLDGTGSNQANTTPGGDVTPLSGARLGGALKGYQSLLRPDSEPRPDTKRRPRGTFGRGTRSLRIFNSTGDITLQVANTHDFRIRRTSRGRALRPDDVLVTERDSWIIVTARPADQTPVDVTIEVPYHARVEAATTEGLITLTGLLRHARLITDSGSIEVTVPWNASTLEISSDQPPAESEVPSSLELSEPRRADGEASWIRTMNLESEQLTYSEVQIKARKPRRIALRDMAIPADSGVQPHWQAARIIEGILAPRRRGRTAPLPISAVETPSVVDGMAMFSLDVRMVNLTVAVVDENGGPITGLTAKDFQILEDGESQQIEFIGAEETPFNLVLLLDCSGSTEQDRDGIEQAARRFIEIARPHDQVAVYALADTHLHVLSELTNNRDNLLNPLASIYSAAGGSPLYDAITLSYGQELAQLPGQRNALILISDGLDSGTSTVSFNRLRKAAESMDSLIYPVFLDPRTLVKELGPRWAERVRGWSQDAAAILKSLANATGGRVFRATSIRDLEPVYPQVADELRSVYSIAYYPRNQSFDGAWRKLRVKVNRPKARVRTRAGYVAR